MIWALVALLAVLIATALAEIAFPVFARARQPRGRIRTNIALGVAVLGTQFVAALFAAGVVDLLDADDWGLLKPAGIVGTPAIAATIVVASLANYVFHVAAHRWTWLWRIHRVHHADTALDISTGFRHHPLESLLAVLWFTVLSLVLGLAPTGLAIYGTVALGVAIVSHADLALPGWLDRSLGWLVVTPAFHHVHHSARRHQTDSNYGDVFTVWDRLFGTRQPSLVYGAADTRIGLGSDQDATAHELRVQLRAAFRD